MKNFFTILLFLLSINILSLNKASAAISGNLDNSGYKTLADFIYSLQKFSDANEGVICVYGSDDISSSLSARYGEVVSLKDASGIKRKCKLIYVAEDKERYLKSFMGEFNNQKVITISFLDNFLEEGGTFRAQIARGGKIKLYLNPNIKSFGIKINPLILNIINN